MKHGRAACVCAILAVTMLAGGCGAKRTTDEDEKGEFTTLQQETAAEQEETSCKITFTGDLLCPAELTEKTKGDYNVCIKSLQIKLRKEE